MTLTSQEKVQHAEAINAELKSLDDTIESVRANLKYLKEEWEKKVAALRALFEDDHSQEPLPFDHVPGDQLVIERGGRNKLFRSWITEEISFNRKSEKEAAAGESGYDDAAE